MKRRQTWDENIKETKNKYDIFSSQHTFHAEMNNICENEEIATTKISICSFLILFCETIASTNWLNWVCVRARVHNWRKNTNLKTY